jgi:hypothetical protein
MQADDAGDRPLLLRVLPRGFGFDQALKPVGERAAVIRYAV